MKTESDDWLEKLDRHWNGKAIPFLLGVKVGVVVTTAAFIVCYFLTGGQ